MDLKIIERKNEDKHALEWLFTASGNSFELYGSNLNINLYMDSRKQFKWINDFRVVEAHIKGFKLIYPRWYGYKNGGYKNKFNRIYCLFTKNKKINENQYLMKCQKSMSNILIL